MAVFIVIIFVVVVIFVVMSLLLLPCKRNRDQFKILQLLNWLTKGFFSIVAWFALTRMICICVELLLGS